VRKPRGSFMRENGWKKNTSLKRGDGGAEGITITQLWASERRRAKTRCGRDDQSCQVDSYADKVRKEGKRGEKALFWGVLGVSGNLNKPNIRLLKIKNLKGKKKRLSR